MSTSPLTSVTVASNVSLDRYHAEPLTMAQALDLLNDEGTLTTVVSLDIDDLIEMRLDDVALNNDFDLYTDLAKKQMVSGDPYDASYSVKAFDPATNLAYVEVTNGLGIMLTEVNDFDLSTPQGRAEIIANFDG